MDALFAFLALSTMTAVGVLVWPGRSLSKQAVELRFPTDVTERQVVAALSAIASQSRRSEVVLDLVATTDGVRHLLHAEPGTLDSLRSQLRGIAPGIRIDAADLVVLDEYTGAIRVGVSGQHPLLRTDQAVEASAGLLGALSPLGEDEAVLLRWQLRPGRRPVFREDGSERHAELTWWRGAGIPGRELGQVRAKYSGPVLAGRAAVAVRAGQPDRGWHLAGRVVSALRVRRGARGQVVAGRTRPEAVERRRGGWTLYSPEELVGLVGWPIDAPTIAGLNLGAAPQLTPSSRLPSRGRAMGRSDWPGAERRVVAQPLVGALSHTLVAGPSGVGKSTLIANLIKHDLDAGRGLLLVDGKGDLADQVLEMVPDRRVRDVIVLDPGRGGPVPGLRVFGRGDAQLTADLVASVLRDIFQDSWGVRSQQWVTAGLVLLAHDPETTLADWPFVFSEEGFRRRLIARVRDPLALATWAAFEAMSPAEQAQVIASPLNKITEVVGRRTVRAVLAQPEPSLDLHDALARGQVVVVRLSAGEIGAPAARLLGALVVHQLFTAVQARASLPADQRQPFIAYVDEPRVLGDLAVPIDSLYEMARGLGVGMVVSAQSLSQLPTQIARAIQTNAASIVAFRQNYDDARTLARDLAGVTPEGLQALPAFTAVMRLALGPGDVAPPVTVTTLASPPVVSDREAVRAASTARYGIDPDVIDEQLRMRHGLTLPDEPAEGTVGEAAPLGRRRRTS